MFRVSVMTATTSLNICHVAMGDLWAGAEVQLMSLLVSLAHFPDLKVSAILFNEGRLADELRRFGIPTHVIPESRHSSWSIAKQLSTYFREHHIDILHTHKYKDNILVAFSSIYQHSHRRVKTVHGFPEPHRGLSSLKWNFYYRLDNAVNRWFTNRLIAVSMDLFGHLVKRFGDQKVVAIHNGINVEEIRVTCCSRELRAQLGISERDYVVGAMGRLNAGKGFECFIQSADIIKRQRPNVKFLIVGDGPLRSSLRTLTCQYGLGDDVVFLGHRDDNYNSLNLFDLFVLPSFSEGIPMVLLEALALARPVVASRVGGIPEVIEHGRNGLLVSAGDADELARCCIALMDDQGRARGLGLAGRKSIEEGFTAGVMAAKVAAVYRKLVCSGVNR
jgi:glycosyltransferase involved in cell wall biosynthesis